MYLNPRPRFLADGFVCDLIANRQYNSFCLQTLAPQHTHTSGLAPSSSFVEFYAVWHLQVLHYLHLLECPLPHLLLYEKVQDGNLRELCRMCE